MIMPNIPSALKKTTTIDTAKTRFLKRRKGTMGSLTRCSMTKKAISMAMPNAIKPSTSKDVQPCWLASERETRSGIRPATSAPAPQKSMSRQEAVVRTNGRKLSTTSTPRIPTGRFT